MTRKLCTIYSTRSLFCLLALGAVVLLAACGNNTSTGSTAAPTATTNTSAGTTSTTTKGYGYGYGNGGSTTSTTTSTTTAALSGPTMTVTITTDSSGNFAFSPAGLTIPVGTTVIWKNMTTAPHTVTSDDGKTFDSGTANPVSPQGGTFSFKFTAAGTFAYHCQFHTYMKATIIVK
jgi:plastocyanin